MPRFFSPFSALKAQIPTLPCRSLLLLAAISMAGCSSLQSHSDSDAAEQQSVEHSEQPSSVKAAPAEAEDATAAPVYRPIPAPTLYSLLVAELAGQRQRFDISLYNYMDQARSTRDPAIAERAARIAQYIGSDGYALEAVGIWLDEDPHNPAAHQAAAQLLMEQGKFSDALVHLETLQELAGISQYDYLAANAGHLPPQQQEQLAAELSALSKKHPQDPSLWYARGIMSQHLQRFPQALNYMEKALAIAPDYLSAGLQKARVLAMMQDYPQAIRWLEKLLKQNPGHKGIQVLRARILLEQRDIPAALKAFTGLHENFPADAAILLSLALLEHELGEQEAATDHFHQLLDRNAHTDEAHFYLGQIAEENGDIREAIHQYSQVDGGREFLTAQLKTAYLISEHQGLEQARIYLDGVRASHPQQSSELVRIEVELLTAAGQQQQALQLVTTALSVMPEDIDLLYTRAMLAERMDNLAILEQDLRTVIRLQPDHAEALNALGYTLADRTDRWSEALPLIRRALELTPDNPAVVDSLGWIYFRMGDFGQARPLLEKAFAMMKDHEIAAHYGELLWLTGEQQRALEVWAEGLQQTPDSPIIERTLERLNVDSAQLPDVTEN